MQNVKLVDYQWVTKSVVEKWYAKFVNKLLPNCINLHVQMHRWHLLELALAQEIEVLKTADFYHYLGIHMSGIKGNNFLRIYKRYEPSFWSKEKGYAASQCPVSLYFLHPITVWIGDYSYMYIQYGISITLDQTIRVLWLSFSFDPNPLSRYRDWLVLPISFIHYHLRNG